MEGVYEGNIRSICHVIDLKRDLQGGFYEDSANRYNLCKTLMEAEAKCREYEEKKREYQQKAMEFDQKVTKSMNDLRTHNKEKERLRYVAFGPKRSDLMIGPKSMNAQMSAMNCEIRLRIRKKAHYDSSCRFQR